MLCSNVMLTETMSNDSIPIGEIISATSRDLFRHGARDAFSKRPAITTSLMFHPVIGWCKRESVVAQGNRLVYKGMSYCM